MLTVRKFSLTGAVLTIAAVCLFALNIRAAGFDDRYPRRPVSSEEAVPDLPAPVSEVPSIDISPSASPAPSDSSGEAAAPQNPDLGPIQIYTLAECIRLAVERNVKLRAAGYDVEAAKARLTEAKAQFWPVLEYEYRMAPVPKDVNHALTNFFEWEVTLFNSMHVGMGFPLATFGQLSSAKRMAEGGVEAARINEAKAREAAIYQIKQLYYGVQLAKETANLLEDAVSKINDKIAEEDEKEIKEIDPYDMLELKLTKVDLEKRLQETRQNLELAYDGLRIQMDLEPGTEINLDSPNLHPIIVSLGEEDSYVDTAMEHQPEAKLIDIAVNTKKLQYKLEKFKLLPRAGLGFFADIGRTTGFVAGVVDTGAFTDPFNYTRAGIGLQVKGDLDFHGAAGRIRRSKAEYYKAALDGMMGHRALGLDIRKAYLNAKRAREDVGRARKSQSIARQMVFVNKMNIDMGLGDNKKYGDSLRLYLLMRGLYFRAVYEYNMAVSEISQRIGAAKFDEMMPAPDLSEYEAFDESAEEGEFETYGIETSKPSLPAEMDAEPKSGGVINESEFNIE